MKNVTIFTNDFLDFVLNNEGIPFLKMKKQGIVVVPVVKDSRKLVLVNKKRLRSTVLEFPRGFGSKLEDIRTFNTYFNYSDVISETPLGVHQSDTGIMDNPVLIIQVELPKEVEHEDLTYVTIEEFEDMVAENKIQCGYTLASAMRYISKVNRSNRAN